MPITLNGTTGITTPAIDASAGSSALTTLSVGGNNISAVNSLGFRNRIINGDMRIDQRNGGASITPSQAAYALDRWVYNFNPTARFTFQQNLNGVTPPTGFTNYLGMSVSSAGTPGSGDVNLLRQRIEGFNSADLAWGTASAASVTISFWVRSSLTGTFSGALQNGSENRTYPFTFSISAANTWEFETITIAGDTTGTWATNNTTGIVFTINLGSGSSQLTTAGAWAASGATGATGQVNLCATAGATFYLTGVQLEAGSVATPFERRDYGRELILCQRYFYRVQGASNSLAGPALFSTTGANGISIVSFLPTSMRTPPTCTKQGSSGFATNDDSTYMNYTVNSAAAESATNAIFIRCTYSSGGQINARGYLSGNTHIDCSSEL
jgi:hypothetical protein